MLFRSQDQPPYADAGLYGQVFVTWIPPVLEKIFKSEFDSERDLWACAVKDRSDMNSTT